MKPIESGLEYVKVIQIKAWGVPLLKLIGIKRAVV